MDEFDERELKKLYTPGEKSHKGQNGKLLVIGGSHLFHAASLWALTVASRIVDMVFYSSVPENNEMVHELKREFRNGIVVPRDDIENYIKEADCVVIGPGMMRFDKKFPISNFQYHHKGTTFFEGSQISNLKEINKIRNEGELTYYLTKYLLEKYPEKKWVIDAGALQMMEPEWLLPLNGNAILTPHKGEFERLFNLQANKNDKIFNEEKIVEQMAKKYNCIILLKGLEDVVCSREECIVVKGGNAGMTKGGTGDVLAGLVGALACNNELRLAATAGSYINKKAGESLFEKVGYYFNASDLADEIPRVMAELVC